MEKLIELHKGKNKITPERANYLISAYKLDYVSSREISIPVEKDIDLVIKARITEDRDALIVYSMYFLASMGDIITAHPTLSAAKKALPKVEKQYISSLFGAR